MDDFATQRYTALVLRAPQQPKMLYEYFVTGSGEFPFDMLRFDECWPASGNAAALMMDTRGMRSIQMRSYKEPSQRWLSFVWSVGAEKL